MGTHTDVFVLEGDGKDVALCYETNMWAGIIWCVDAITNIWNRSRHCKHLHSIDTYTYYSMFLCRFAVNRFSIKTCQSIEQSIP